MKTLILLDIDNTLFDSSSYRADIFENLVSLVPAQEKIQAIKKCEIVYDGLRNHYGFFDPKLFLEKILPDFHLEEKKEEIYKMIFDSKLLHMHVHKEVLEALKKLSEIAELGIFSQGEKTIQSAKLVSFLHLLKSESIHIAKSKKDAMESVFKRYNGYHVYFVDDVLPILENAKQIAPDLITIWIKRGRFAQTQQPLNNFAPDAIIETLDELMPIIKKSKVKISI